MSFGFSIDGNYISDEEVDEPDNDAVCPFGEVSEAAVERSLMDPLGSNRKFGEWEQHTKVFVQFD